MHTQNNTWNCNLICFEVAAVNTTLAWLLPVQPPVYHHLTSKEHELIPLAGATSSVWKHFGFPAVDGK